MNDASAPRAAIALIHRLLKSRTYPLQTVFVIVRDPEHWRFALDTEVAMHRSAVKASQPAKPKPKPGKPGKPGGSTRDPPRPPGPTSRINHFRA